MTMTIPNITKTACALIPTAEGEFQLCVYLDDQNKEHLALIRGEVAGQQNVLVRLHSE